jgi:hypothetical protein
MQQVSGSQSDAPANSADNSMPRLRRVLTLKDLIIFGIMAVTPSAPVTVFGLVSVRADFALSQSSSTSENHDREPLVI